jgi:hypothetical protein
MKTPLVHRLASALILAGALACIDGAGVLAGDPWLQSRPCGPDSLKGPMRLLIPQGAFGADFRQACRRHDACYDTPGANRAACDARFLDDMLCSCTSSRHPALCRMTARLMHRATAKNGEDAFRSAQAIAMQKLAAK